MLPTVSRITFTNQPKLSTDSVDEKFNKRRLDLIPFVEAYVSASPYFKGDTRITFSHAGISSLVCFIESVEGKKVLKVALSLTHSLGEARFLKVWERAGVKVPHVFDSGEFKGHPYTLMEYIPAESVGAIYTHAQMIDKGVYKEMGSMLHHMHEAQGKGYGMVVDDHGEYNTFKEWINGPDIQKRIVYAVEKNLLSSVWDLFPRVLDVLTKYTEQHVSTSYCHDDFGGSNILATKPLTVFDPNPRFNNRYMDIGRTMAIYIAQGIVPQQILEGYFETETCDTRVLYASIFLNIVMKAPYSHKKGREDVITIWEEYLASHKSILE